MPADFASDRLLVTPLSVLSIAVAVSIITRYQGGELSWIMTAVLGGAIVTEILVHYAGGPLPIASAPPPGRARTLSPSASREMPAVPAAVVAKASGADTGAAEDAEDAEDAGDAGDDR
jgi:hypothetical protein